MVLEKRTPCHPKYGLAPATGHITSWDALDTTPDLQRSTRLLSSSTATGCVLLLEGKVCTAGGGGGDNNAGEVLSTGWLVYVPNKKPWQEITSC